MKQKTALNHYEKLCEEWQERFLTLDQEQLTKKLPGLRADGDFLTFPYFNRKHGIHRQTGEIISFENPEPLTYLSRMNIYTLLWFCKDSASFQGEWMPFRNLKDASPFGPAFQKTVVDVFARTFSGHLEALEYAFLELGGKKLSHSDAGYQLDAFPWIPLQFLFWDGDEEFPAQANILFDKGAVDFIHVESLVSIASEGLALLTEAAKLPMMGNTYA